MSLHRPRRRCWATSSRRTRERARDEACRSVRVTAGAAARHLLPSNAPGVRARPPGRAASCSRPAASAARPWTAGPALAGALAGEVARHAGALVRRRRRPRGARRSTPAPRPFARRQVRGRLVGCPAAEVAADEDRRSGRLSRPPACARTSREWRAELDLVHPGACDGAGERHECRSRARRASRRRGTSRRRSARSGRDGRASRRSARASARPSRPRSNGYGRLDRRLRVATVERGEQRGLLARDEARRATMATRPPHGSLRSARAVGDRLLRASPGRRRRPPRAPPTRARRRRRRRARDAACGGAAPCPCRSPVRLRPRSRRRPRRQRAPRPRAQLRRGREAGAASPAQSAASASCDEVGRLLGAARTTHGARAGRWAAVGADVRRSTLPVAGAVSAALRVASTDHATRRCCPSTVPSTTPVVPLTSEVDRSRCPGTARDERMRPLGRRAVGHDAAAIDGRAPRGTNETPLAVIATPPRSGAPRCRCSTAPPGPPSARP